jgi:hypothetical protein
MSMEGIKQAAVVHRKFLEASSAKAVVAFISLEDGKFLKNSPTPRTPCLPVPANVLAPLYPPCSLVRLPLPGSPEFREIRNLQKIISLDDAPPF